MFGNYSVNDNCTVKLEGLEKQKKIPLANFAAKIRKQTTYRDGINERVVFTIDGVNQSGNKLKEIEVDASKFDSLQWVNENWGIAAIISPEAGAKADLKTAIQILSSDAEIETIYQHTCLLYTSPSPRDATLSRMPSSA